MGIKTQLNINKWASVNILDVKFQVHLGAEKVQGGNCHEIKVFSKQNSEKFFKVFRFS